MNNMKLPAIMILITLLSASLAGCIGNEENKSLPTITIAYYLAEDSSANANAYGMAERLEDDLGIKVELYDVASEGMIIIIFDGGHAINIIEDSKFIEIKQGPYDPENDKERF